MFLAGDLKIDLIFGRVRGIGLLSICVADIKFGDLS